MIADNLLREVLLVCRCKSSIPLKNWVALKKDIEDYLSGKKLDSPRFLEPRVVVRYRQERGYAEANSELLRTKAEAERLKRIVKVYQAREAEMWSVLRGSVKGQLSKIEDN